MSILVQADTITGNKSRTGDELGGRGGWRDREEERQNVAHVRCTRNADKSLLGKRNKKQCEM